MGKEIKTQDNRLNGNNSCQVKAKTRRKKFFFDRLRPETKQIIIADIIRAILCEFNILLELYHTCCAAFIERL